MLEVTVEMENADLLIAALKDLGVDVEQATEKNVATAAINISGRAKQLAPVLKIPRKVKGALYSGGNLRKSIHVKHNSDGPMTATVGASADYAEPVEKGHKTRAGTWVPAQPFLFPAAEQERPNFVERQEEIFTTAIKEAQG